LVLAFLIEVLPVEADLLFSVRQWGTAVFLLAKIGCLAVVLTPLSLYVLRNGWQGIVFARGKVLLIGLIVLLKLGVDFWL